MLWQRSKVNQFEASASLRPSGCKLWREIVKSKKFRELLEKEKKEIENELQEN